MPALRYVLLVCAVTACRGPATAPAIPWRGDPPAALRLHPCVHRDTIPADCGALQVPERRDRPDGPQVVIPIVRLRATGPSSGTPVFYLEGGPGSSNLRWRPPAWLRRAHDVVLVGYRGVDGSVRLDCEEVDSVLRDYPGDLLGARARAAIGDAFRTCRTRLGSRHDLGGYTIEEVVSDLDVARGALGYQKMSLYSTSYGTRVALRLAARLPGSVERSIQVGVNPPGAFVWEPPHLDTVIVRVSALCQADPWCRARTPDLATTMRRVARHMPRRWGLLRIDRGAVLVGTFGMLYDRATMATVLDAWLAADRGDASGLWLLSFGARRQLSGSMVWGDAMAKAAIDYDPTRDYTEAFGLSDHTILGAPMSAFAWSPIAPGDVWSGPSPDTAVAANVETLLISGDLDVATPAPLATSLLARLPRGHQILVRNAGHLDLDRLVRDSGYARLILRFLDDGVVDASGLGDAVLTFEPRQSFPRIAKLVVGGGAVVGAALLWGVYKLGAAVARSVR